MTLLAMNPAISKNAAISTGKTKRIESIDLLRGIVMLIMAIDHARDYFNSSAYLFDPTDLSRSSVPLFLTRWITHFCAPIFMFLAGVSACLYGLKNGRKAVSFFLFTRGTWLLLLELFIVTLGWDFNLLYPVFILQVIWAFGISMIGLSLLVFLDKRLILFIGILLIAAHNLLDPVHVPGHGPASILWLALHEQGPFSIGPFSFFMGYPVLPWIGIIATGYCCGTLYSPDYDPAKRKKVLLTLGLGIIALFILLRFSNVYGDRVKWSTQKNAIFTFLSFLNTTKYPPSLLYTMMTLGPALLFLAFAEGPLNWLTRKITVLGRVPMFFYLLHIYLLHAIAIVAMILSGRPGSGMILTGWVTANAQLKGFGFGLTTVYGIWILVVVALYPLCKWYDKYKREHLAQQWWLSYL
jgi:uncharacterized membrane protein